MKIPATITLEIVLFPLYFIYSWVQTVITLFPDVQKQLESFIKIPFENNSYALLSLLIDFYIIIHLILWTFRHLKPVKYFFSEFNIFSPVLFITFLACLFTKADNIFKSSIAKFMIDIKILVGSLGNIIVFWFFTKSLRNEIEKEEENKFDTFMVFFFSFISFAFGLFIWLYILIGNFIFCKNNLDYCGVLKISKTILFSVIFIKMIVSLTKNSTIKGIYYPYNPTFSSSDLGFIVDLIILIGILIGNLYNLPITPRRTLFIPLIIFLGSGISLIQNSLISDFLFCGNACNDFSKEKFINGIIFSTWYLFMGVYLTSSLKKILSVWENSEKENDGKNYISDNDRYYDDGIENGKDNIDTKKEIDNPKEKNGKSYLFFFYESNTLLKNYWIYYLVLILMNQVIFSSVSGYSFFLLSQYEAVKVILNCISFLTVCMAVIYFVI